MNNKRKQNFRGVFLTAASTTLSACGAASRHSQSKNNVKEESITPREIINFNTGWLYSPNDYENGSIRDLDDSDFEEVSLPTQTPCLKSTRVLASPTRYSLTSSFVVPQALHARKGI